MYILQCVLHSFRMNCYVTSQRKIQQNETMYKNVIIPYLYEAQLVSGDTPPIIRSLKLHWQPLVFHTWKAVGRVVGGRCQAHAVPDNVTIPTTLPGPHKCT